MELISTDRAAAAVGPYSQAVEHNGFLITSGQLGIDPETGELGSGIEAQTRLGFSNLQTILEEAGCSIADVMKTTVFLVSMDDFALMNEIYGEVFGDHKPARSCVAVAALPKGGVFEIECIAALP